MHVGVPGCCEWQTHGPGEVGSEDAEFAGAGDVNEVGLETLEFAANEQGVTPEERVEVEVLFHADRGSAAAQFQSAEFAGLLEGVGASACANAKKGQIVSLCIGDEVPAGVRHAVDLVEGVGKVGYTRHVHPLQSTA